MTLRIAVITNELPPYRVPFFKMIGTMPGITLQVLFCSRREPNRAWALEDPQFDQMFLQENILTFKGSYVHSNYGVVAALTRFAPNVVVTGGFNPTHLYAFAWSVLRGVPHVTMTDGTLQSESRLSVVHRSLRRIVFRSSRAHIAASQGGIRLLQSYGRTPDVIFKACLCVDNARFRPPVHATRVYDFLFCGRLEGVKNPLFAIEMAAATAKLIGRRVSLLVVGSGSLELRLRKMAFQLSGLVDVYFRDITPHDELPELYQSAKLFIFPSQWDPWGVVANEACAAGMPVLVSTHCGAANDLIIDGHNGFVRELDVAAWAKAATRLLNDEELHSAFSKNALDRVAEYNYERAAAAVANACRYACRTEKNAVTNG